MNVSLSPKLEALINEKVASGVYSSASEVLREALQLLDERDREQSAQLDALRKEVAIGIEQLERGEYTEYTDETLPELREKITKRGQEKLAAQREKQKQ